MSVVAASVTRRHAASTVFDRFARFASSVAVPLRSPTDAESTPPEQHLRRTRRRPIRQETDASGSAFHAGRPLADFNARLERAAERGELSKVLGQMQRMQADRLQPDVLTYEAILKALAGAGRAREALDVLEDMADAAVEPSLACYNLALKVRGHRF